MESQVERSRPQANEHYLTHPRMLGKKARREHVVDALLAYNSGIIEDNPEGATAKFEKLMLSPFVFLRGTADLMYRDLVGTDTDMATVLCMGDVHLENFGVMKSEDGSLIWGLNDFDEAEFAPFSWDVKRAATSTVLAAADFGFKKTDRQRLAKAFAAAYLEAIKRSKGDNIESKHRFTKKHGPPLIRKLIKKARGVNPKKWLKSYVNRDGKLRKTDEITPISVRTRDLQESLNIYVRSLAEQANRPPQQIKVLDVAAKTGSGTGSVGLWRFYALSETKRGKETETLILEIKRERPSVLSPYVGQGPFFFASEGSRVAFAENIYLPGANPYYGYTLVDGLSYLVRERSPHKARIKLDKLKKFKDFQQYVKACGAALAFAHARSHRALAKGKPSSERQILQSVNSRTFDRDIGRFAMRMAAQVTTDWKSFKKAHKDGKFSFT